MLRQHTRSIKKVRIGAFLKILGGDKYAIKALSPADFLKEKDGLPLNFFKKSAAQKSMYETTLEAVGIKRESQSDTEAQLKTISFVLGSCIVSENGAPFDIEEFMKRPATEKSMQKMFFLFWEAIKMSFKRFRSETPVSGNNALSIFIMAKKFGRPPIDILFPDGDYSEMDAYMFNIYIASVGIEEENRQAKKAMSKK
jgi:hypothetical protein